MDEMEETKKKALYRSQARAPAQKGRKRKVSPALRLVLLVAALVDQRLVDVRDDAAARDRRLDERVELLVAADGELQVARGDALDLEVLGGVAGELEDLGGEVLWCWLGFGWLAVEVGYFRVEEWRERAGRGF